MAQKNTDKAKIDLLYTRLLEENMGDFDDVSAIEQQHEVAQRLGVDPGDVTVKKDILTTRLAREGVIVSLNIGRTRFEKLMSPEDIGINKSNDPEFAEFLASYVMMGRKRLIPVSLTGKLDGLESKARRFLKSYSFETCYGFFVPYTGYEIVKNTLNEIRQEYFAVQEEILDGYYSIRHSTETTYRDASINIYRNLMQSPHAYPDYDWQEKFVSSIMELFPSRDDIEHSFYFNINLSFVPVTVTMEEQQIRNDLLREKADLVRYHLELEHQKATEKTRAELEKQRTKIVREQDKQERIREINREVLQSYQQQMDGFVGSVVGQLRSMVYEACVSISSSMEKNGHLAGASTRRITNLVGRLKALNFMNDEEVNEQIAQLETIVNTNPEHRNTGSIMKVLDQIASSNRETLNRLNSFYQCPGVTLISHFL